MRALALARAGHRTQAWKTAGKSLKRFFRRPETNEPVGSAGLMIGEASRLTRSSQEAEIGYWIGVPYWGQGLVPEAVAALIRYAKEDLHLSTLWCGYFDGNEKSRRVQEKCGFVYDHSRTGMTCQIEGMRLTEHISKMSLENSGAVISEN